MNQYTFSQDDHFTPVYCRQCRQHTPQAVLQGSLCPDCIEKNAQASVQAVQQALAEEQRQKELIYNTDTGHGYCPECKSRNVEVSAITSDNQTRRGLVSTGKTATAASALFFWPALVVSVPVWFAGSRQPKKNVVGQVHKCAACGFEW